MVPWDTGLWDSDPNDFWDLEFNSSPTKKQMFEINLKLKNINAGKLVERIRATVTGMTGNAAFTTPDPALADLTSKANALEAKVTARDAAKAAAKALTKDAEDLISEAKDLYKQLGDYVAKKATTEGQVQSAAMEVKAKAVARPVPDRIEGLEMTPTDNDGELDMQWDPDEDAVTYDVETNDDPDNAATWKHQCACTDSRHLLTGFPSGVRVWGRVRGRNAAGVGPWSDVAVRRTA